MAAHGSSCALEEQQKSGTGKAIIRLLRDAAGNKRANLKTPDCKVKLSP
jgi:hypothetical protein